MPPKKEEEKAKSAPPKGNKKVAAKSTEKKVDSKGAGKAAAKTAGKAVAKTATKAAATKAASKTASKTVAKKSASKAKAKTSTSKANTKTVAKKATPKGDKKTAATAKDKDKKPTATAKTNKKQPPKKRTLAPKSSAGSAVKKGQGKQAVEKKGKAEKVEKKKKTKSVHIEERKKKFHIGGDLKPNRNIGRMVKWPAYIRLQRRKKIMFERLKVPSQIHQFSQALEKHSALQLFQLIKKYRPESEYQRKKRLLKLAADKKEGKAISNEKPFVVKFGANHVTTLVEQKKAKLVVIASDVDPIEHVLYLPALCHKLDIPYVIVKNKARLGTAVHMKTCAALAFVNLKAEDKGDFTKLVTLAKENYNDRRDHILRTIGGGKLGLRSSTTLKKRKEALEKAQAARANLV